METLRGDCESDRVRLKCHPPPAYQQLSLGNVNLVVYGGMKKEIRQIARIWEEFRSKAVMRRLNHILSP